MQQYDYFSSCVYRDERPDLIQTVLPVYEHHTSRMVNVDSSYCRSDNVVRDPSLRQLSDYLLLSTNNILRSQGYMVEKYDFYVSNIWALKLGKKGVTDRSVCKNSQIKGYFFIEVPNICPSVDYYDTRIYKNMIELECLQEEAVSFATNTICFKNMQAGTVLLSNSWMEDRLIDNGSGLSTKCLQFTISHRDILCNTY
jgi:hypothetical protein